MPSLTRLFTGYTGLRDLGSCSGSVAVTPTDFNPAYVVVDTRLCAVDKLRRFT